MDRRLISTIVVISVIYLGWIYARRFFVPPPPEQIAAADGGADAAGGPADAGASVPAAPSAVSAPAPAEPAGPEEKVEFENPDLKVVFTTRGGAVREAVLKAEKFRNSNLVKVQATQPYPLALEWRGAVAVGATTGWSISGRSESRVTFTRRAGDLVLTKEFTIPEKGYLLGLTLAARNEGSAPAQGEQALLYPAFEDPAAAKGGGMFSPPPDRRQALCRAEGKTRRVAVKTDEKDSQESTGAVKYAGIEERFFVGAIVPRAGPQACAVTSEAAGTLSARLVSSVTVQPGATAQNQYAVYFGPKDGDHLAAAGAELETAIDFGFWEILAKLLLRILKWFHLVLPNWGLAIIALTLLVKVLTFPLAHKSMKSGEEMKRLAPKLEELKKKYGADQQRLGAETMKLYKEHNVNPFGGCLPMLIQMPIWIALYTTLYTAVELYNEPFIRGWINDLTANDPFYALPLAMGATMFITQVLTPMPEQQPGMKFMMYGLPVMFTFFMLGLPSGLVLYIFTSNVLSILQQLWFRRVFAPRMK